MLVTQDPFRTFALAHELVTPASDLPAWFARIAALMMRSLRPQRTRSGLRRAAAGVYRVPHGELDLGSVAHRVDDNNSRDRHSISGFRGPPHPNSDARRGHAVASVDDPDNRNRRCRVALGCAARDRSWYLGNGILVAWRAPLPQEALLYSVDSITTRGASGLMLERGWRMMGALEAADGMLLFGISTAFIFAVMQLFSDAGPQSARR